MFFTDKERSIEECCKVKIGRKMSKSVTVYFFIFLDTTFDKKKEILVVRSPRRGVNISIYKYIL
jgi:hypothetical protein